MGSLAPSDSDVFTSTELAAAEHLVELSSSASLAASSSCCSSTSSWPLSVNTDGIFLEAEGEEEEVGLRRRMKRYRKVADLYAATEPIAGGKRLRTYLIDQPAPAA